MRLLVVGATNARALLAFWTRQKCQNGRDPGVASFDHRPVSAVGEDVNFAVGDVAHRQNRHVHGADAVIASPGQQRRRLILFSCAQYGTAVDAAAAAPMAAMALLLYIRRAISSVVGSVARANALR